MAFAVGNRAGHSSRAVDNAIRRVLAKDKGLRLIRAVDRLFDDAADGDTWQQRHAALAWIADRTDGKAIARVEHASEDPTTLSMGELARLILQARAADAVDAAHIASDDVLSITSNGDVVDDGATQSVVGETSESGGAAHTRNRRPPSAAFIEEMRKKAKTVDNGPTIGEDAALSNQLSADRAKIEQSWRPQDQGVGANFFDGGGGYGRGPHSKTDTENG